ncbi:hypothetical protein EV424DRAFT_668488 [Suillus variegatus]|nr:hypothetical protein EV424DRAFT_668488 [Suillus variegatus]
MKSEFGAEKTKEAKSALPSVFRRLSHEYTSRSDVAQPQALGQSRVRALNRLTIVNISAIRTDSNSTHSRVVTHFSLPLSERTVSRIPTFFPSSATAATMPVCKSCGRSFVDQNALRMHSESKHGFECTHCDRVFKTSDGRDSHDRTKHCFSCGICDRQFNSEEALDKHKEAKHRFPCGICDRQFSSEEALDQHKEAKHCLLLRHLRSTI